MRYSAFIVFKDNKERAHDGIRRRTERAAMQRSRERSV